MTRFLPLIVFVVMVALFAGMMLSDRNPKEIKSVLIGRPAPDFSLADLMGSDRVTTADALSGDRPVLVNFFASWCVPCRAEHQVLLALSARGDIKLIGIAYKDKPADSRAFLDELGDPFDRVVIDQAGATAFDFGVSGAPESFVIDRSGIIRARLWGPMVGDAIAQRLNPALGLVGLPNFGQAGVASAAGDTP